MPKQVTVRQLRRLMNGRIEKELRRDSEVSDCESVYGISEEIPEIVDINRESGSKNYYSTTLSTPIEVDNYFCSMGQNDAQSLGVISVSEKGSDFVTESDSDNEITFQSDSDNEITFQSDSDNEITFKSDSDDEITFQSNLKAWAIENNLTLSALGYLLKILKPLHSTLPTDARSFLQTQRKINAFKIVDDDFFYFGVEENLQKYYKSNSVPDDGEIKLFVNIDGIPLFKSSPGQFWPILAMVKEKQGIPKKPFLVALFYGNSKPKDLDLYLRNFVSECLVLTERGIQIGSNSYKFSISSIICDAPARSFIKRIKGHTGYHGCERCVQEGQWSGRMIFLETNSQSRTDDNFKNRSYPQHHQGVSPLENLSIGMISSFPLDPMHLIYLGVCRKLILLWMKGPLPTRLPSKIINQISERLILLQKYTPNEFARKPRGLSDISHWKATEFRQFLMYTSPVVLYKVLPKHLYDHFMLFQTACYILASEKYHITLLNYAKELLQAFVTYFSKFYGKESVVYNVHNLIHVTHDVELHGPIDGYSAFPFESLLGRLIKKIHGPKNPFAQVIKRVLEADGKPQQDKIISKLPYLSMEHKKGPCHIFTDAKQFQKIALEQWCLRIKEGDNCCMLASGKIVVVNNIIECSTSGIHLVGKVFQDCYSLFCSPFDSSNLSIFIVENPGPTMSWPLSSVAVKCYLIPHRNQFVSIPLLHYDSL